MDHPNSLTQVLDDMFKITRNRTRFARALNKWVYLKTAHLEHVLKRKIKSQLIFLRMNLLKIDFAFAQWIMSVHLNGSVMLPTSVE